MGQILKNSFNTKLKKEIKNIKFKNNINFIKEEYLKHGYINNPKKEHRVQFNTKNIESANNLVKELSTFDINSKISVVDKKYIVYINDINSIKQFLIILSAKKSLLFFEKEINNKSLNSNINRIVNFEVANIKKATKSALKQVDDIKKLLEIKKMSELDQNIRLVIEARLNNPTLSLNELSIIIGNISKSTLNHRFSKIRKMLKSGE